MNTVMRTTGPDSTGTMTVQLTHAHRVALLTARTGLEQELAKRYAEDPCSLLAEFGLPATEPVYGGGSAAGTSGLVIEDLSSSTDSEPWVCWMPMHTGRVRG